MLNLYTSNAANSGRKAQLYAPLIDMMLLDRTRRASSQLLTSHFPMLVCVHSQRAQMTFMHAM